jgi:predicted HAD superfamily phosphohydrolase YqeG
MSIYNQRAEETRRRLDMDNSGTISKDEIETEKELVELEMREDKAESQRMMAWIAILTMFIFTLFLFSPIVRESRVAALADLLGLFYIAQAGIVGAYMGTTAWVARK